VCLTRSHKKPTIYEEVIQAGNVASAKESGTGLRNTYRREMALKPLGHVTRLHIEITTNDKVTGPCNKLGDPRIQELESALGLPAESMHSCNRQHLVFCYLERNAHETRTRLQRRVQHQSGLNGRSPQCQHPC
jgi:hypothetical protein